MAFYDSGVIYGSGARYDEGPPSPPTRRTTMSQIKIDIDGKDPEEILSVSTAHIEAMAEPAAVAVYATPEPSVAAFQTSHDALQAAVTKVTTLEAQLDAARTAELAAAEAHKGQIRLRATYIQLTSKGDPIKIELTGFSVRSERAPVGEMPAPVNFLAQMGSMRGSVKLKCKPVKGSSSYVWEWREHVDGSAWQSGGITTAARTVMTGLVSGKEYAFRVAAVGAAGRDHGAMRR